MQALFLELVVDGCVVHERLRERVRTTDALSLMKERWRDTKEEKERDSFLKKHKRRKTEGEGAKEYVGKFKNRQKKQNNLNVRLRPYL